MTIEEILTQVKPLAVAYYRLTGKPLGVTGEVGEFEVAHPCATGTSDLSGVPVAQGCATIFGGCKSLKM